jgi:hypothetical protein
MWGLFGFAPVAGLVFLTLLPAIRRGPAYLRGDGSPWPWPLYPWTLFGLLGLAVPARAWLLCWSFHLLDHVDLHEQRQIFGWYFVVPFAFAIAVLLLEFGLVSGRRGLLWPALGLPGLLVLLSTVGHRVDPVYQGFMRQFHAQLGADPLYLALLLSAGFYAYAAVRRAPAALEGLTVALVALACVDPHTLLRGAVIAPRPLPLLAAGALLLGLGLWWRQAWRCLLGAAGLVTATALVLAGSTMQAPIIVNLALAAVLVVGAVFDDAVGRLLRIIGIAGAVPVCALALYGRLDLPSGVPTWVPGVYPLFMTGLLVAYGQVRGARPAFIAAAVVLALWLALAGWHGYVAARGAVAGLDYLVLSLALFLVAVLISLGKSGLLTRWFAVWGSDYLTRLPRPEQAKAEMLHRIE